MQPPSSKDALRQVCLKLAQWFWRKGFFNFVNAISLFCNYLHFEKGRALRFNKSESPSPKNLLHQVLLILAQWFWRRTLLNFVNVFSQLGEYLPFEKGGALYLYKFESRLSKDALCQISLKLT